MKKLVIVLLLIGFAVFMTWDSEEKQVQKENNVQQIEVTDYLMLLRFGGQKCSLFLLKLKEKKNDQ